VTQTQNSIFGRRIAPPDNRLPNSEFGIKSETNQASATGSLAGVYLNFQSH
jgi:hypothetical protein